MVVGASDPARSRADEARYARLEAVWQHASDAIVLADDSGRYLDVNPAAEVLTGRSRKELVGASVALLTDLDPSVLEHAWAAFLEQGRAVGDFTVVQPDGTRRVAGFVAVADIAPGTHLSVMRDMTERRQAEQALADSEQQFRTITEHVADGIYRVRFAPEPALTFVNPAVEELTGFTPEVLVANPDLFLDRCHPDDLPLLHPQLLVPGEVRRSVFRFLRADGQWRWFEDHRSPLVEDGRVVGAQGAYRDVTEREALAEHLRRTLEREQRVLAELRSVNELRFGIIQAVSHELRTPASVILGYADTLVAHRGRLAEDQVTDFQQRLRVQAQALTGLLDDILDLERLGQQGAAARSSVDLSEVVERVLADVDTRLRPVQVEGADRHVVVDRATLERILANLLSNAVKHTPEGARVQVTFRAEDDRLQISVDDDGPGVPSRLREAVFEPFWQGQDMAASPSPGTGIGLPLVRLLAVSHGGRAWLEDSAVRGTRVRVDLATGSDG